MGGSESKSCYEGNHHNYEPRPRKSSPARFESPSPPRHFDRWQQEERTSRDSSFNNPRRTVPASNPLNVGCTQSRQTPQAPRPRDLGQTTQQNDSRSSQEVLRQTQKNTELKKQTLSEVVQSLKKALEGYDGRKFSLEGINALYRESEGESIPFAAHGFTKLSSFIETKVNFLTVLTAADGTVEILLKPPSYHEAVNSSMSLDLSGVNTRGEHDLSSLVHGEISQIDLSRLRKISENRARDGLTILEFDNCYFSEFLTRIDYRGFSKVAFFRGLDDIVEVREEKDNIKLYSKVGLQNVQKAPQKNPLNTGNRFHIKAPQHVGGGGGIVQKGQNGSRNLTAAHRPPTLAQQPRLRSHNKERDAIPIVGLGPTYEKELKRLLQNCKTPGGVTPEEFKAYFQQNTSLDFCSFGFSDEEFFSRLPHIFQVIRGIDGIRLLPRPLTTGLARSNAYSWQSVPNMEGSQSRASREKVSASIGNVSSTAACSMHMLVGGRCLWIVSIANYEYVPTGCVAKLADMAKDNVLNDLWKYSLNIRYIQKVGDDDIKKVLVNNNVASSDEIVMAIPLKSVPLILRAFLGKNVDDALMANLEEVSREHVRNKRFGRPHRQ